MYLNLGGAVLVRRESIVGVFDLDTSTVGGITKQFLRDCEKNGYVTTVGDGIPKAFVLTVENNTPRVYITTLSAQSLKGRAAADW